MVLNIHLMSSVEIQRFFFNFLFFSFSIHFLIFPSLRSNFSSQFSTTQRYKERSMRTHTNTLTRVFSSWTIQRYSMLKSSFHSAQFHCVLAGTLFILISTRESSCYGFTLGRHYSIHLSALFFTLCAHYFREWERGKNLHIEFQYKMNKRECTYKSITQ